MTAPAITPPHRVNAATAADTFHRSSSGKRPTMSSFKLTLTICHRPVMRMYRAIRNAM